MDVGPPGAAAVDISTQLEAQSPFQGHASRLSSGALFAFRRKKFRFFCQETQTRIKQVTGTEERVGAAGLSGMAEPTAGATHSLNCGPFGVCLMCLLLDSGPVVSRRNQRSCDRWCPEAARGSTLGWDVRSWVPQAKGSVLRPFSTGH